MDVKKGLRRLAVLCAVFLAVAGFVPYETGAFDKIQEDAPCTVEVVKEYMLPVCELASTLTEPEVIKLANGLVEVSLVPNRGRVLFEYLYKPTGVNYLYASRQPIPFETADGYIAEFGGYYLSLPWNTRDRQPYDLEREIVAKSGDEASVRLWARDPATELMAEILISLRKGSSRVEISSVLKNDQSRTAAFIPGDHCVMAYPAAGKPTTLWLPAEKVVPGENQGGWMGPAGQSKPWPQPWLLSSSFRAKGEFAVPRLEAPFFAVAGAGAGFVRSWSPADIYDTLKVFAWGTRYGDELGGERYAHFVAGGPKRELPAGGSMKTTTYLYAASKLENIIAANGEACVSAIWDAAKKQARFAVARPAVNGEAVRLTLTLAAPDGKILGSATSGELAGVGPNMPAFGGLTLPIVPKDLAAQSLRLVVVVEDSSGGRLLEQTVPAALILPLKR